MRFCKMLNEKEIKVIALIDRDTSLSNYFFNKVKDLKWFYPLMERGFFLPPKIPHSEGGDFLFWNVLDYLERVSEQVTENPKYGKELIEIIDSVVQFSLNKKRVDNYHIWLYCVKILNNIPIGIIKENLSADKFKTWLSVWLNHSAGGDLVISEFAQKLLPKFLVDDSGIEYAETIINAITEIRASGKTNTFTKQEEAVLVWDAYWIQEAFKINYHLIGQKCSLSLIFNLADILKKALEFKQKEHYVNIEIGEDVYQIEVSRVFVEGLKEGEIGFKVDQYKCIFKQFSQEQLKSVDRKNDFWALHNIKPEIELKHFTFSSSEKDAFIAEIKANLPEGINWASADKFEKQITDVYDGLYLDYSNIWFKSLSSGGSEHARDADEVLTNILLVVLLAKCEANRLTGKEVLRAFLSNRYIFPIFKRFGLLCIDKFWTDYSYFLERFIELFPTALEDSEFEVELQDILLHHNAEFSEALKAKLKELISAIPSYYIGKGEEAIAFWQYKWLSPLRDNDDFSILYKDAIQKVKPKGGKPYEPLRETVMGGFIGHTSPVSKEDILQKPIAELVNNLREFKGADFWQGAIEGEPDIEGLADVLQSAVKDDPGNFSDEMDAFIDTNYFYLHRIFRGFNEAWNAEKDLDWEKVFNFALKYFGRDKDAILKKAFQAQGEDSGNGKYIWIVEDIVDLIADGCRDDARAFDPGYFDSAEQIFGLVLPLINGEKHPDTQNDALTYALNNTFGRTVKAYVSFSLRVARATKKKYENWGVIKYERFFEKGIDAYIWFGHYLPQMKYLDEEYTKAKIDYFAEKDPSDFEFQMFMEGYLTGAHVYPDLYKLMRSNYLKGLASAGLDKRADKRLVQHICIGFLQNDETLQQQNNDDNESLFWKMLIESEDLNKSERWMETVEFFWIVSRNKENEETFEKNKRKILEFWAWTYEQQEIAKAELGDNYNSFLGQIAELTILLDKIDEKTEKWLVLSAPHISLHHNAGFFIEYLTKFEDEESIKRIGKIFLKVLENTTPTFRQENVIEIVRRIYDKGDFNDAEAICNTYGRRGVHFLKPVREEYQKKKKPSK